MSKDKLSAWAAETSVPAGMHIIICIALRYNKPIKITKVFFLLCYFNKTRALVLFLGFRYFDLQNIYKDFEFV